jgi:hypothetical protein
MVDYASFYVDPRPMAQQFMADTERRREFDKTYGMKQLQMQNDQQQNAFSNQMSRRKDARAEQYLDLQRQATEGNRKKLEQEIAQGELKLVTGIASAVNGPEDYSTARATIEQLTKAGVLRPMWLENMPIEYDKRRMDEAKEQLRAAVGKETWSQPAPIAGGRGAIGQTEVGSGKTTTLVGQRPQQGQGGDGKLKKSDKIAIVKNLYTSMTRGYMDPELKDMYRRGPENDPGLYERLDKQALQAKQRDFDLIDAGKEPHYIKDLINKAAQAEGVVDWAKVQLPAGVTQADVEFTAKQHGVSEKEVLERIGAKGGF